MKRVFSLLLAVLLVFGSIPTSFAHAETAKPAATGDVKIGDIPVGGTFTVGMWPQHLVEDESLLAALEGQECNMFSYGFGYGSNNTVGGKVIEGGLSYPKLAGLVDMRYGDIVYAGTKYRKVVVNTMRMDYDPSQTTNEHNTALAGTYYFKWEPIEWIVLERKAPQVTGGESSVVAIAKNVLAFDYTCFENAYVYAASCLAEEVKQSAFCNSEKSAFKGVVISLSVYGSLYNSPQQCEQVLSTPEHGYLAPLSHYAQLTGSYMSLLNENRESAYAPWQCGLKQAVEESGEIIGLEGDGVITHYGYRPTATFRSVYVIKTWGVHNYLQEHTHSYGRHIYAPDNLAEEASCKTAEKYYSACKGCASTSTTTFTAPQNYFSHTLYKEQSARALRHVASAPNNPATFYYCCSVCGEVVKDTNHTFRFEAPCPGHNFYRSEYPACGRVGTATYICRFCGYTYSETISTPVPHEWDTSKVYSTQTVSEADCSHYRTYYNVYQCTRCYKTYTDTDTLLQGTTLAPQKHVLGEPVSLVEPTCTKTGLAEYHCIYCDYGNQKSVPALGHDDTNAVQNGYNLITPATCTGNAVYAYACSRCHRLATEKFTKSGSALGHDYTKKVMSENTLCDAGDAATPARYYYTCMHCGAVLRDDKKTFTAADYASYLHNTLTQGGTVTFGSWPQTLVEDTALIEQLNQKNVTLKSYKYRYTPSFGAYYVYVNMRYADVTLGGETYRKVTIGSYRSDDLKEAPSTINTYQSRNGFVSGESYWFKWEPITWQVLRVENETATLIAKNVLAADHYLNDYTGFNTVTWAQSSIRRWLQETFYESAFTAREKADILLSTLSTADSVTYGTPGGEDTKDYVYIPAGEDIADVSLQIATVAECTPYAVSMGLRYTGTTYSNWMTRTPSYEQCGIEYMNEAGEVENEEGRNVTKVFGVRPMLRLSLARGLCSEDVNRDGVIDIADVSTILYYLGDEGTAGAHCDLNVNGAVDIADLGLLLTSEKYGK